MKKYFLITFLLIAGTLMTVHLHAQNKENELPNIVLFIGDDIGWDDIGCYGNKQVQTPNIDKIAQEGIRFTNVFLTASSCSPSRCSIISGRYPHNTGAPELYMGLPPEVPLFPEILNNAGYYTAHAGKWHMGDSAKRSFDVIHENREKNGDGGEEMWLTTLQDRPKEKPFFMWFASYDAHRPWGPNIFTRSHDPSIISLPVYHANTEKTRVDHAKYFDEIKRFDYYIGKIQEELKRQGVLKNTIILIMSDNGRPFPRDKTRVYDSGMKTPFIIRWDNGINKKGIVCKSLISAIDLAPTIIELARGKSHDSFQGRSFAHVIKNPESKFRNYIFSEHNWHDYEAMERMVRTKEFMYVLNLRPSLSNTGAADVTGSPSFQELRVLRDSGKLSAAQSDVFIKPRPFEELYNCLKDSSQLLNIASMPEYAGKLEELRHVMDIWRIKTADTTPDVLTKDWFNRETGTLLPGKKLRGEMPGGKKAISITAGGPF